MPTVFFMNIVSPIAEVMDHRSVYLPNYRTLLIRFLD